MTRNAQRSIWILVATCLLGSACTDPQPKPAASPSIPRSVLLVTIDTWRVDHIGIAKDSRVVTPVLDRLASGGVYVDRVQTPSPLTAPSHASILTGLIPPQHGLRDNLHFRLDVGPRTLAELFSENGYRTLAVVSAPPLRRVSGLDRGFDRYLDEGVEASAADPSQRNDLTADQTTSRALEVLRQEEETGPVFLWVHYYDPHTPYAPPEPFRSLHESSPYAGEVAFVDHELGRLIDGISGSPWTLIVTGDHGEGLGDHGEATHGMTLYREVTEVPLIIHPRPETWRDPDGPVALIDILPTLCGLLGIEAPAELDGSSLLSPLPPRVLATEATTPTLALRVRPVLGLRKDQKVWFHHGGDEIYDLDRDPGQLENLATLPEGQAFRTEMRPFLDQLFGDSPVERLLSEVDPGDAESQSQMAALGYLGSVRRDGLAVEDRDVRELLPVVNDLVAAREAMARGTFLQAVEAYRRALEVLPDAPLAHRELGQSLFALRRFPEAASAFDQALQLEPRDPVSAFNLGNLMVLKGEPERAVELYRHSISLDEHQPTLHRNLGDLLARRLGREEEGAIHLSRFLELAPEHPSAPEIRAWLAARTGKPGVMSEKK